MLTPEQVVSLRAACFADPTASAFITNGQANELGEWLNTASPYIVWKKQVMTEEVGKTISYIALAAMTATNLSRVQTFYDLNPEEFQPRSDIRTYFADAFSGALGGEGANTRAALEDLCRRAATNGERLLSSGVGSTAQPGDLTYEGFIPITQAVSIVFRDNGTIWTP